MGTKKVRILARVGDPSSGVVLQAGATVELPDFWADRYIAQGNAEAVDTTKAKTEEKPKGKGRK